ncbi:recombinase family protein [Candidatus Solirubrobacter pratensis]|uniref:recombinase family protein n=1 Tax=Candidatus Solirubrobacter pratensis TaxID=1298857 RepID=UPI000485A226|nr:recombinase family protein [Candidatus Solirubrobacter pratensis]
MRVLAYLRVSTEEQRSSGAGLEAQRATIAAECGRRGWSVVRVVEDAGFSAKDLKRPGVQAALDALKRKEADALVVSKLDRLSRSMLDFTGVMATAQKQNWALVALDCAVDTTTPAGEAMAHVLATFAQFERRLIGQRTRDALAVKKAQGVRLGRPRQLADEVVARIVMQREQGSTLKAIADSLNDDGVPTAQGGAQWYPSSVRAVLGSAEREQAPRPSRQG